MQTFSLGRALRKFFLSAFVIFTFGAYALHERFANPAGRTDPAAIVATYTPTQQLLILPEATPLPIASETALPVPQDTPTPQDTPVPQDTPTLEATSQGQYKDGVYTGPE